MKKIALFIFILISAFAYSQDTSHVKAVKPKRVFIGVNFSPDLCYRRISNISGGSTGNTIVSERNQLEIPKFGFTSGVNFCYVISKNINVTAGIQYSNIGYQNKEQSLVFGPPPRRTTTLTYNVPIEGKTIYTYNYLDIPLKTNFVFGKKKTRFIAGIGLTTNILLSAINTFKGTYADGSSFKNSSNITNVAYESVNKLNLSPAVSLGIDYKISNRMFFKIEPTFNIGVLKTHNAPIGEYIWNAGLNLSYYFGL